MKFTLNEGKKFILEERFTLKESEILTEDKTSAEKLLLAVNNLERWVPSILEALPKAQTLELDDNLKALCADVLKTLEKANIKYLIAELKENAALYQADKIGKERHKGILGLVGDKLTGDFQSVVTTISNIQKSSSPVKYTFEKLQQKLNDIKTHIAELQKWIEENEPNKSNGTNEDWAAKYNAAVNKDAVWEEYLNTVWENDFDKIIKIQEAFRQECVSYGFDDTNPFFAFIKDIYLKNDRDINVASYNAVHNAVANKIISAKDLTGSGQLGLYNIIFCKDLYSNAPQNIKAYLQKQANLIKKGIPKNFNSNLEFIYNTMYQTTTLIRLDKLINDSTDKNRTLNDLKLNSFSTINSLEQKWTGESSTIDDDTERTEEDSSKLNKQTNAELDQNNDNLIKQISSLKEAAQILVVLNLKFASNQKLKSMVNQYKETSTLMAKSTTSTELQALISAIENKFNFKNISEERAVAAANKIVTSNKFKFTKA